MDSQSEGTADSDLDRIAEKLQQELWSGYSKAVIDHAQNPRNVGQIENPDGYASVTGSCGDTIQMWVRVSQGIVKEITFWTDGCGTTIAAGSATTELVKGKEVQMVMKITAIDVLNALEGLPEENQHCALLAADTLGKVMKDFLTNKSQPWKRLYPKR
ncbi:iron-sulfur cluster assembly scaffold protein [Chloroflexota bacterium]